MFNAILRAEHSIYWEVYIFEQDLEEFDFLKLLADKARAGCRVRIVLDNFGSMYLSEEAVSGLREAGAEVLFFNGWFRRIHRKILIVDEQLAFLGGVNVGKQFKLWKDLSLRLSNKKIVRSLVKTFSRSYYLSGGTDPDLLSLKGGPKMKRARLWILEHFPSMGQFMLRPYYEKQIAAAEHRVVLVTPYFIPHRWLLSALLAALARGVEVEVIVPQNTDNEFISFANHVFISQLHRSGIKFYTTSDMIHAKAILVDDRVGLVGSNNIDARSFDTNAEAGISFEDEAMVKDLKNIIEAWKAEAKPFSHNPAYEGWYYRFMEQIVRLIQPLL